MEINSEDGIKGSDSKMRKHGKPVNAHFSQTDTNSASNSHPRSNPALLLPSQPAFTPPPLISMVGGAEKRRSQLLLNWLSSRRVLVSSSLSKHGENGTTYEDRRPNDSVQQHTRTDKEAKHEERRRLAAT